MSLVPFETLPDSARLWCFGADRGLTVDQSESLSESIARFVERWTAHDRRLAAGFELTDDRFLLVAVDEDVEQASGCSIDTLLRELQACEAALSVTLVDGRLVWFRGADGAVRAVTREAFKSLANDGEVGPDTPVFDLSLTRVGQIREGRFELPASESWHSRYLAGQVGTG